MCAPALGSEKKVFILQILYYKHTPGILGTNQIKFSILYSHLIGIWYPNDIIWPDNLSNNLFWASKLTYSDLLFMIATSWKFQCFTSSKWVHWATECYHKIHEVRKDECKLELLAQMWTYYVSVYDHTHTRENISPTLGFLNITSSQTVLWGTIYIIQILACKLRSQVFTR